MATVYPAPAHYDLAGIPSHYANNLYQQNTYRGTGGFDAAYWSVNNNEFTEKTNRFFGNAYVNFGTKFNTENHKLDVKYQMGVDAYTTHYQDIWGYGHANGKGQIENSGWTTTTFNSLLTRLTHGRSPKLGTLMPYWVMRSYKTIINITGNMVVHIISRDGITSITP